MYLGASHSSFLAVFVVAVSASAAVASDDRVYYVDESDLLARGPNLLLRGPSSCHRRRFGPATHREPCVDGGGRGRGRDPLPCADGAVRRCFRRCLAKTKKEKRQCQTREVCGQVVEKRCSLVRRRVCPEVHLPAPETREGPSVFKVVVKSLLKTAHGILFKGKSDGCRTRDFEDCVEVPVEECHHVRECTGEGRCDRCSRMCGYEPRFPCFKTCA